MVAEEAVEWNVGEAKLRERRKGGEKKRDLTREGGAGECACSAYSAHLGFYGYLFFLKKGTYNIL